MWLRMGWVFIVVLLFVVLSVVFWIDGCGVLRLLFGVLIVGCWVA